MLFYLHSRRTSEHLYTLNHRDRAEERRKGLNPDYERNAMSGLPGNDQLNPTMSVEETKYLGGDLEHTHLVKGLDYALLQKVSICSAPSCTLPL